MVVNGFEIRELPNGYVDCVSWGGTVMNTLDTLCQAVAWAKSEQAPVLSDRAKAELQEWAA